MPQPSHSINWSENALNELEGILAFWDEHNRSPAFGDQLTAEIDAAIQLAAVFPYKTRLADDDATRFILVRSFVVFYRVAQGNIDILSVWDSNRDPTTRPF